MKKTLKNLVDEILGESPEEIAAIDEIIKAKQAEIIGLQKQKAAIQRADQMGQKSVTPTPTPNAPTAPAEGQGGQ